MEVASRPPGQEAGYRGREPRFIPKENPHAGSTVAAPGTRRRKTDPARASQDHGCASEPVRADRNGYGRPTSRGRLAGEVERRADPRPPSGGPGEGADG